MTTASISELKARLSAYLDAVRDGDEVLVTDRGRPVARLVPVKGDEEADGQRELLLRSGRLRAPSASLAPDFWTRPRARDADGRSLSSLLEERDGGR
jgi:prevent-host-death family protein